MPSVEEDTQGVRRAKQRFGTTEQIRDFLTKAGRPRTRELSMGVRGVEAAIPGLVEGHETDFIDGVRPCGASKHSRFFFSFNPDD